MGTPIPITARVAFDKPLQRWDGFGCNYVEMSHTLQGKYEDYGSFSEMADEDVEIILAMIFGANGLRPHIVKIFLNPYLLDEPPTPGQIELDAYRFDKYMPQIIRFAHEGMRRSKEQGIDLRFFITMYGPPAWATTEKRVRAQDLEPEMKEPLATFLAGCAKYLREREGIPVEAVSIHNEGEDKNRYPPRPGDDFNMYWPKEQVAEFLPLLRTALDESGWPKVKAAPGETTYWTRFDDYAQTIANDEQASQSIGLITSHGFGRRYSSAGVDTLRKIEPKLPAWTTSCSWQKQGGVDFASDYADLIYQVKLNALIPWAIIQTPPKWPGGDPNPNGPFIVNPDRSFTVNQSYYYYKQISLAGQGGMVTVEASCAAPDIHVMAFGKNGTDNPDALVVVNRSKESCALDIRISQSPEAFTVCRTTMQEQFVALDDAVVVDGSLQVAAPAESVTTFFEKLPSATGY